jgi:hypothetical protein
MEDRRDETRLVVFTKHLPFFFFHFILQPLPLAFPSPTRKVPVHPRLPLLLTVHVEARHIFFSLPHISTTYSKMPSF